LKKGAQIVHSNSRSFSAANKLTDNWLRSLNATATTGEAKDLHG
jgi:hypothetical protein